MKAIIILILFYYNIKFSVPASSYTERFLEQYSKIINPQNGYYSKEGVPYHSLEALLIESTDYGHETDSEAFSYNVWLKAVYGAITGDFEPFNQAWDLIDDYMIPKLQTNTERYDPLDPVAVKSDITVGTDPLFKELKETYDTSDIYLMHWLADVDNIYGFGNVQGECELGPDANGPSLVNLGLGSLWEGFSTPTCDNFKYGGINGFQFTNGTATKSYHYAEAPDADARAVQAAFWASRWATEQGDSATANISHTLSRAAKMADYIRYTFYEQYFKQIGNCIGKTECPGVSNKSSAHYLLSWGISWGGSIEENGRSWRCGNNVGYYGYQNPIAAYGVLNEPTIRPKGATAIDDWTNALERQMELYEYLQTKEGAFAAGVTNSWNKNYEDPPQEYKEHSFYGMWFDYQPGFADANPWYGFQPWTADRVAQYYYVTDNQRAKSIIEKWIKWALTVVKFDDKGDYSIPTYIKWTGLPPETKVEVTEWGQWVGSASATARTLSYYAAKSGDIEAKTVAKKLLDTLYNFHRTNKGIATNQTMTAYSNFNHKLYIPLEGWTGTYPNGDVIEANSTFLSVRSWLKNDSDWQQIQDFLDGGSIPQLTPHRFWEQADIAIAFAVYGMLFDE